MAKWKDITSYSRGDKERKSTTWEIKLGSYRLIITRGHRDYPNQWVMHLYPHKSEIKLKGVPVDDIREAKVAALQLTEKLLKEVVDEAYRALNDEGLEMYREAQQ